MLFKTRKYDLNLAKKMQLNSVLMHLNAFPGLVFNSLHVLEIHNPRVLTKAKPDFDPATRSGARLLAAVIGLKLEITACKSVMRESIY